MTRIRSLAVAGVCVLAVLVLASAAVAEVESTSVSEVTQTSAKLEARINPEGHKIKYRFWLDYFKCDECECNPIDCEVKTPLGGWHKASGDEAVDVRHTLTDLSHGCSYEFWVESPAHVASRTTSFTTAGEYHGGCSGPRRRRG